MTEPQYQGFPFTAVPLVDGEARILHPWHRFFIDLWRKLGGSKVSIDKAVYIIGDDPLKIINVSDNIQKGIIRFANTPGAPGKIIAVGASPFEYSTLVDGQAIVFASKVEFRRGAGSWFNLTLNGGMVSMLNGDSIRLTWFTADKPELTFFPDIPV